MKTVGRCTAVRKNYSFACRLSPALCRQPIFHAHFYFHFHFYFHCVHFAYSALQTVNLLWSQYVFLRCVTHIWTNVQRLPEANTENNLFYLLCHRVFLKQHILVVIPCSLSLLLPLFYRIPFFISLFLSRFAFYCRTTFRVSPVHSQLHLSTYRLVLTLHASSAFSFDSHSSEQLNIRVPNLEPIPFVSLIFQSITNTQLQPSE